MATPRKTQRVTNSRGADKWLEAAVAVLIKDGIDAVCIDHLAVALGITRGSFYHHYRNRDDLLRAVLEHYVESNQQRFLAMLPRLQGTPQEKLWVLWSATADQTFRDYEWAIRMWGLRAPHVAEVLQQIDSKRMDVLMGFFMELGFTADEAWIRAALAYHGSLGDRAYFAPFPPMEKRLLWRRLALGLLTRQP